MNEGMPWATQYASFIFLGVSILIGYLIWRVRASRRSGEKKRSVAEELLAREIAQLDAGKAAAPGPDRDGSGLGGPAYTDEERDLLERARTEPESTERDL